MARSSESPLLLLDTNVWLWVISATGQLSPAVRTQINDTAQTGRLRLSTMSLWEISLLASRSRIELGEAAMSWIVEAEARSRIVFEPLSPEIAVEAGELPGDFRSGPADRIIVATARVTGATLATRDRRILAYAGAGHLSAIAA
jgi:PIN domain nuclease of toxin-antitoxin system